MNVILSGLGNLTRLWGTFLHWFLKKCSKRRAPKNAQMCGMEIWEGEGWYFQPRPTFRICFTSKLESSVYLCVRLNVWLCVLGGVGVDFQSLSTSATMDFSPILRRTNFFALHTIWETSDWCDISLRKKLCFVKVLVRDQFWKTKQIANHFEHGSIFVILVGFLGPNTRPRKHSATRCEWIRLPLQQIANHSVKRSYPPMSAED